MSSIWCCSAYYELLHLTMSYYSYYELLHLTMSYYTYYELLHLL
jgi:hypothetical protein